MQKLNVLLILVAVKLCDSHGHFSHQSILDTSLSGLFSGVNKVHEVASAVVGKFPGLNVNFESNVQVGGGGNYRPPPPQYPNYNQPQKKPEELVIVIVDENSSGHNGQRPPQYSRPPQQQGQYPPQQGQGGSYYPGYNPNHQGYKPNHQGYKPNQNYAPNNNYQPNFPSNNYQTNFHSNNNQPNYENHNNPQEDCEHDQQPNAGRPRPGYGGGGGYNQYPNYDNNVPSSTPQAQQTPPATTPQWHDNQNAQSFPTASPTKPTESGYTSHNQQPGQGPDNQGYQKPVDHDDKEKNKIETTNKPAGNDEPLLVPLNPNEYVYGGDNIMINAPKRETSKETSTKAPVKDEEEEFPIDIRFGD